MATRKTTPKHPKLPNGFGRITEIKKRNLRNPFRAMVTVGRTEEGRPIGKIIGYYSNWYEAYNALTEYHKNPWELSADKLTIADLYKKWSDSYFNSLSTPSSVRTITAAWLYVTPTFRRQDAVSMSAQALKDFIEKDACLIDEKGNPKKASENIQSRIKSVFNLMYDYAVLANIVQVNPARQFSLKGIGGKIERKRKDKTPFPSEHIQALWDDLEYGYTRMILINVYSGWRPQELVKLEKANIDLEKMTMIGGMKTEAGTDRMVPIHPKIQDLVRYYYDRSPGKYLFYDYDDTKPSAMTYDKYRGRFKKIMARHSWDCYSPSCPRHTFSTNAKTAGMDELARKLMMGHEITDVTDKHYTHMDLEKFLAEEIQKL